MKKLLFSLLLLFLQIHAWADNSGTCGENVIWTYDEKSRTLTISGSGAMWDFKQNIYTNDYGAPWQSYWDDIQHVIIENGVTSIGDGAFYKCKSLISVTIPPSVIRIRSSAFYDCNSLTSVHISDIAAWCKIYFYSSDVNPLSCAHHLFLNGEEVKNLVIPEDVTSVGKYAFFGCNSLISVTIPSYISSIGEYAFCECVGITSVTVQSSPTYKSDYPPFSECNNIKKVIFDCENVTSLLSGNPSIEEVEMTEIVTSIGRYSFEKCSGLLSITIPKNVTSIGSGAFAECTGLSSAKVLCSPSFENYTKPFSGCNNIKDVQFDCEKVTSLFSGINSIENVSMTENVKEIDKDAFSGCNGLITVEIPQNVTIIGENAFKNCSGLISVTMPNTVTTIEGGAFSGCSSLQSFTICRELTSIGKNAFGGCKSLETISINSNAITSKYRLAELFGDQVRYWELGDSILELGDYSLSRFYNLESISIPQNLKRIGNSAFSGCKKLSTIDFPDKFISIGQGAFSGTSWYELQEDGVIYAGKLLYSYKGTLQNGSKIVIKRGTKGIADGAFYNCNGLYIIVIPESILDIGDNAFYNCSNLKEVHISDLLSWCKINFTSNNNPLALAHHLFVNDEEVINLIIPSSVERINDYTFNGCSSLESVSIPDNIKAIGASAFKGCTSMKAIHLNDFTSWCNISYDEDPGWTSHKLYKDNVEIKEFIIPENITAIGKYAFYRCDGLCSITIPHNINSISNYAFYGCSSINDVYCHATKVPATANNAFENNYISKSTLHVPEKSIEDYRYEEPWYNFGSIVALSGEGGENKCATPMISYKDGKLVFECETEGVEYVSEVSSTECDTYYSNEVALSGTYIVKVYATKAGYQNSDTVIAEILVASGKTGGDVNGDGVVNAADIVEIVKIIMASE